MFGAGLKEHPSFPMSWLDKMYKRIQVCIQMIKTCNFKEKSETLQNLNFAQYNCETTHYGEHHILEGSNAHICLGLQPQEITN